MATDTDETYFRKYLDDPLIVAQNYVPETDSEISNNETTLTVYLRKYLNDNTTT